MTSQTPSPIAPGLIILYTGNGKGKSTAAFGQALRAAGHGQRVCIIQFLKGTWQTGETLALSRFAGQIEIHIGGSGFTWVSTPEEVSRAATAAWQLTREKVLGGGFDLVILDELTYLLRYQLLPIQEVLALLNHRPPGLHLLITGRNAAPELLEAADLVTEMREIKHPFRTGIPARRGIEY